MAVFFYFCCKWVVRMTHSRLRQLLKHTLDSMFTCKERFVCRYEPMASMQTAEPVVKENLWSRKKTLLALAFASAICFVVGILIGYFAPASDGQSDGDTNNFDYTRFILHNIDKERIRENLRQYSSQPRLAGTALDVELAHTMEEQWRSHGLDEVHLATYHVLLSYPNSSNPNVVQIVNTTDDRVLFESSKFEVPLTENENNSNVVPPFNGFAPAGDVTGEVVYVNYGRIEDFEFLANNLSVNVSGRVVIARYGAIFRADKLENAELFNAAAVILFSDPGDYNVDNGVRSTYPHSWWLPPSGVQRGTTLKADPLTPLYPATDYAYTLPLSEAKRCLPQIPTQPIGYGDAQNILSIMGGPAAPDTWQGGLNFTYRIGPGFLGQDDSQVRVIVNNYVEVRPVHNVIGYITGSEEPDRYVLLGNHHDAWVFGAVDPLSGSAALTEMTRVFGSMLAKGHRPRRTVVFCSWDAEEYGLLGSLEWVEDHLKILQQRAVAYLNMDSAVWGNYSVLLGTSPLLHDFLYQAARQVPSPDPAAGETLYDLWKARPIRPPTSSSPSPYLTYSLGSSSDMGNFYQRAGVPCINLRMTYDEIRFQVIKYPIYHSRYETFFAYDTFIDPGFTATESITKFMAVLGSELANADLLPLSVDRYSAAVSSSLQNLLHTFQSTWQQHNVNIDAFRSAANNFTAAAKTFREKLNKERDSIMKRPLELRRVNDQMIQLERMFLDPEGLPGRPDQKHILFAPSRFNSYVDNTFPGIVDTMFEITRGQDQWEQLKQQVYVATYTVQSAASSLEGIGL